MVSYFTKRIEIIRKVKFVHVIKFVKVRELSPKRKVRFACAEQHNAPDQMCQPTCRKLFILLTRTKRLVAWPPKMMAVVTD